MDTIEHNKGQSISVDRLASVLPDGVTTGYFLVVWFAPFAFGAHTVRRKMVRRCRAG